MYRCIFILLSTSCFLALNGTAQVTDWIQRDSITYPVHRAHIGQITFMQQVIPIDRYTEGDFLKGWKWEKKSDLNIRVFLGNSLTNYLHALAPDLPAATLTEKGNYQFTFYVDGQKIYTENLHHSAGTIQQKNTQTVFRIPLISSKNEDSWGRFLWNRFLAGGGTDALSSGQHTLLIEIRPYLQLDKVVTGEVIAYGQLLVFFPEKKVPGKAIPVQAIRPGSGWEVSTAGIDSSLIETLNRKIAEETFRDITSLVVIRDGKLLLEEYFNGAQRKTMHDMRSVGKSFASTLAGMAIRDGYLQSEAQQLGSFYDLRKWKNYAPAKDSITLKSLLTMSSGFLGSDADEHSPGNEGKMYPTSNWVDFTLNLPMDSSKISGRDWDYFTAGVVLLGDILQRTVPGGLEKYAGEKLFAPLGIEHYRWEYTPQKVANTAGGLRMRALDFARFGQLYCAGGRWNGQQILPEDWTNASLDKQVQQPGKPGESYGYLFWNKTYTVSGKSCEVSYASGNGGNKIFILKDQGIVIVVTAKAYDTAYAHPQVDQLMEKYLLPAVLEHIK